MKTERNANHRLISMLANSSHALYVTVIEVGAISAFTGGLRTFFKPPIPKIGEHDD
ncbi:hypothetical protein [Aquirhabdus sp.]|uniref:hypothetical protein n=1 Tax=Aquirhabdus sp. TaxID=2824160 RepID=UPI00396CB9DF